MVAVNKKKLKEQIESKKNSKPVTVKTEKDDKQKSKVVSSQLEKKMNKKLKRQRPERGVVFIKNLPHGFFEEQLKAYFGQFGKVTRVRLARSPKTTNSRGFAYIEFQFPEVAEIAAETMNNYMMFKKVLKTAYIPPEQQKFNYFRSGVLYHMNKDGKPVLTTRYQIGQTKRIEKHNRMLTEVEVDKRKVRTADKIKKLKSKLAKLDVDYDVDSVVPESFKNLTKDKNDALKSESEDEESELDETIGPDSFAFEESAKDGDDSDDEEGDPMDEDSSDEELDPKQAKKKLNSSIVQAKVVGKKLIKEMKAEAKKSDTKAKKVEAKPKKETKQKKIATKKRKLSVSESESESEPQHSPLVKIKKDRKKLVGVEKKKPKKPAKVNLKKLETAAKKTLIDKSSVKVMEKKEIVGKKSALKSKNSKTKK